MMATPKTRRPSVIKTITDIKTHNLQAQIKQLQAEFKIACKELGCLKTENVRLQGKVIYHDGHSCKHPGCISHLTHPCEHCLRVGGQGEIVLREPIILPKEAKND